MMQPNELKSYVSSVRNCKMDASSYLMGPRNSSVTFDFSSLSDTSCILVMQRHSGNGKVTVICGGKTIEESVSSKVSHKIAVQLGDDKLVKIQRGASGIGSVAIREIIFDMDWKNTLLKADYCKAIKITNGKAIASEGSAIKSKAIREVVTDPPNMYKINSDNSEVTFAGSCEIVSLQLDGDAKTPASFPHLSSEPQVSPVEKQPASVSPVVINKVIFDTRASGFNGGLTNKDAKPVGGGIRMGRQGSYSVPLSLLKPHTEYSVMVDVMPLSSSGNSKFTLNIIPSSEINPKVLFAARKSISTSFTTVAKSGNEPYKLVLARHPSSTGDIVVRRIVLIEGRKTKVSAPPVISPPEIEQQVWPEYDEKPRVAPLSDGDTWRFKNIPKTLHLYWGNSKLPFLRYVCLYSFAKFNPDWEIKLHVPEVLGKTSPTWGTTEQRGANKVITDTRDCMHLVKKLSTVKVVKHDFKKYSFSNDVHEVHKSDFLRWVLLSSEGGVWADTDIIFIQPMSFMTDNNANNADKDTGICLYPHGAHAIGFLMSSPKNAFYTSLSQMARKGFRQNKYQSIGADLLNSRFNKILKSARSCKVLRINPKAVYSITDIPSFISANTYVQNYPDAIGFHWYGGHPKISDIEAALNGGNYTKQKSFIAKLVNLVME